MSDKYLPRRPGQDRTAQNDIARGLDLLKNELTTTTAAYTPGNSAHWSGDPTTIAEAIDRIAAAVFSGTSGAIA